MFLKEVEHRINHNEYYCTQTLVNLEYLRSKYLNGLLKQQLIDFDRS